MAYTDVDIANMALIRIGADVITSMTDTTDDNARKANAIFEYVRDEVLEAANWTFALARAELVQDATAPTYGYDYRYAKPTDCLRIIALYPETEYVVEGDYILTDFDNTSDDLFINYTTRITNPTKYSARFVKLFALKLAAELAVRIHQSTSLKNELLAEYDRQLTDTLALDRSHNYLEDEAGNHDWINAGR